MSGGVVVALWGVCQVKSSKRDGPLPWLPAPLGRLLAFLWGPGRTATGVVVLSGGLALATAAAWQRARAHVLASGRYSVRQEQVVCTPLPNWIHTNIRAEVFRDANLEEPLSILDDGLPERISHAFSLHPWVEKVRRVKRLSPARVEVDLVYRCPVCMVEAPGEPLPVDAEGVVLPAADFSPIEKSSYPRLTGVDTVPMGPAGQRWGDGRVVGGAEVAAVLGPVWHELKLERIEPLPHPRGPAGEEPPYQLITRGGTHIYWGLADGGNVPGELPAAEKLARLERYFARYGTLEGRGGPQTLDVRKLPAAAPEQ
jgi:hypothetical protein